jgi:hypothetical protein
MITLPLRQTAPDVLTEPTACSWTAPTPTGVLGYGIRRA